eukprot:2089310-Prymnesium_polylepis.1
MAYGLWCAVRRCRARQERALYWLLHAPTWPEGCENVWAVVPRTVLCSVLGVGVTVRHPCVIP